jgi:4-hydroxybenzoate polyprenyltransferase
MSTPALTETRNPKPETRPGLRDYLELVKFSHTVFALPFALAAMLIAASGLPAWSTLFWIVVAMAAARTAAMGFNRLADSDIDALNPRTANREIPAGKVSLQQATGLVIGAILVFALAAWRLNELALLLSMPTLAVLFFYSYCKRFTAWSHIVLGFCLGLAPIGAWIAVRGRLQWPPIILGAAILFWVAGFDIIYATMDAEFDRKAGLHSMVQKLGVEGALQRARIFHAVFVVLLLIFGKVALLGWLFFLAVVLIGGFLVYEHKLVRPDDLKRVNAAFFTVNGAISLFFLVVVALEMLLRWWSTARIAF